MSKPNFRQIKAIEAANKNRIQLLCPAAIDCPGIYVFYREENGIKYAYVGQAKKVLTRLAEHLTGYEQHIDKSIRKHGLFDKNPNGYKITVEYCLTEELDEAERKAIKDWASRGFQLRNKTVGGQDSGKVGMNENAPSRGYRDGLKQGYKNAQRDVAKWFEKNLVVDINGKPNKNKEKALQKFFDFIEKRS